MPYRIQPPEQPQTFRSDPQSEEEHKDIEHEGKIVEDYLKDQENLRRLRLLYAHGSFWVLAGWSVAVTIVIFFCGFRLCNFNLSDTILSILVGSTMASIIGLVAIMGRGLFKIQ